MIFNSFLKKEKKIQKDEFLFNKKSSDYSDFQKTKEEKLSLEKRRRYQIYQNLDYRISVIGFFDLFSIDAFNLLKNAKFFAQGCGKKLVTSEILLLSFLSKDSALFHVLKKYELNTNLIGEYITDFNKISPRSFPQKQTYNFKSFLNDVKGSFFIKDFSLMNKIIYSRELNKLFEKAAENALTRFKTPIISSEILFLTLMEEKTSRFSKILKKFLKNDMDWYLLRYDLLKSLHSQESVVRNDVIKNHHYFAYLLKTQLSDLEFKKLMKEETFPERVSIFRNKLVREVLNLNLFELISHDIYFSIKATNNRKYSF
jgi:hypothetical protein